MTRAPHPLDRLDFDLLAGRAAQLHALTSYFDAVIEPTPIPWHHERRADHDLLAHRAGPRHNQPLAFQRWAARRVAQDRLFALQDQRAGRTLLIAPVELTVALYDRGDLTLRSWDSVHGYLHCLRRARAALKALARPAGRP